MCGDLRRFNQYILNRATSIERENMHWWQYFSLKLFNFHEEKKKVYGKDPQKNILQNRIGENKVHRNNK